MIEYRKEYRKENEDYLKEYSKEYHMINRIRDGKKAIKRMYGISPEDFETMISSRDNKCDICKKIMENIPAKGKRLESRGSRIDHCHVHNEVRGILCDDCNKGLGHFKDSIPHLQSAIKYLGNYVAKLSRDKKDYDMYYKSNP